MFCSSWNRGQVSQADSKKLFVTFISTDEIIRKTVNHIRNALVHLERMLSPQLAITLLKWEALYNFTYFTSCFHI